MFLNCIHYSELGGFASALFYAEPSKKVIKNTQNYHRHNKWPDSFSHSSPHKQRTQPKRLDKPSVRPMPLWKPAPPPNRPPDGPRWTNGLHSKWCHCPPETRSHASIQLFKGQKREEHVRFHLLKNSQCCGWWYFSGTAIVKLGLGGLFSLGHFSASKFVFQSCSSAAAGTHGEAETHVWKTTREEKGPKLHKIKRTATFLRMINSFIYDICVQKCRIYPRKVIMGWVTVTVFMQ